MQYYSDENFPCSERFDINLLKKAMCIDLDRLANFAENPIYKEDIEYYIIELYKGVQIFEQWSLFMYDELDDDTKQKLREKTLERNKWFLTEARPSDIKHFYEILNENYNRIRSEVKEKLNAAC